MGRKRLYTDEQRRERKKEAGMIHYHKNIERSREKRRHAARRWRAKKKRQESVLEPVVASSNESRHVAGTHSRSKQFSQIEDRAKSMANRERMKSGNLGSKQDLGQSRARVGKAVLPPRLLNYPRIEVTNKSGRKDQANIEARREVESSLPVESHHRGFAMQSQGTSMQPEQLAQGLPAHSYFMGERLPPSSPPSEGDSDDDSISANCHLILRILKSPSDGVKDRKFVSKQKGVCLYAGVECLGIEDERGLGYAKMPLYKQLQDLYAVIRGLKEEVTRLEGDKSGTQTMKNALSNARRQFTRNTNKAEKLEKSMKIAAANEALTLPASQALKRGRTEANTGEPQAKRKVRYVDIDSSLSRSSSLSPPPDDLPGDGGAEEQQNNVKERQQPSVSEGGNDTVPGGKNSEETSAGDAKDVELPGGEKIDQGGIGDGEEPSAGDAKDVELPGGEKIDQGGIGDGEGVKLRGDEKGEQAVNGERAQSNAQEGPNPSSEGDDGRGPSDTRPDPTTEADDGRGPSDTIIDTTAETPDLTVANNDPENVLPVLKPVNLYRGKSKRRKGTTEDISILSKSYAQLDEDDKEEFC
ncbi:hypothetical protein H0H93_014764, partial [Arthromyces matolae]